MSRIRLSKEYGLNPSILKCPLCKKDMAIDLNGYIMGDKEASRYMYSRELCDECKKDYIILACEGNIEGFLARDSVAEEYRQYDVLQMTREELEKLKQKQNENNKE